MWLPIAWLALAAALLYPITRWFGEQVRGLVLLVTASEMASIYVYFFLLLPGTLLHEASHWLTAKLLGVRTGYISLRPKPRARGVVQFGAVQFQRTDPWRESLIGLAPLVVGSLLVLGIAYDRLGLGVVSVAELGQLPARLLAALRAKDAWLWIYFLVSIANAMLPSPSDRHAWRIVLIWLGVGLLALLGLGLLIRARVPPEAVLWLGQRATEVAFAFTLTLLADLGLGLLLWGLSALLGLLLGRRVVRA